MSDCHKARNGAEKVRKLQRALYLKSKQDKEVRFYSLYDKVWREDVLWEAWRQVKANKGAPGIDGKANTIYIFPAKSSQQKIRSRLKYLTSRRAPISPKELVGLVNPIVTGWANYFRHTNASQAFRGLQRFVNIRVRRYLTQSKGRGFGWKRYPNSKLYAMGLVYIGSGMLEYMSKTAHGLR